MARKSIEKKSDDRERVGEVPRRRRIPLSVPSRKLTLDDDTMSQFKSKGLVPRYISGEDPGRIQQALGAGYDFYTADGILIGDMEAGTDRRVVMRGGKTEDGKPYDLYLMAIPIEFYEEDKRAKARIIDEIDHAIRKGVPPGSQDHGVNEDQGGVYIDRINYKT